MDDLIIKQLADMTMSKYVSVRKAAQRALDSLAHLYDGTRSMLLSTFFEALKREFKTVISFGPKLTHDATAGNDPDRMKGALYVLGSKTL